jgi:chromosome segregation ATPase
MTRPEHPMTILTGHPFADAERKYDNTLWPPAVQRQIKAELDAKKAEAVARVNEMLQADERGWAEGFDAWSAEADAVADRAEEVALLAREGRLTADELDKELTRLDARRKALIDRAGEHERLADRIEAIKADPLKYLDSLYARYPAMPRPDFSYLPGHGL